MKITMKNTKAEILDALKAKEKEIASKKSLGKLGSDQVEMSSIQASLIKRRLK